MDNNAMESMPAHPMTEIFDPYRLLEIFDGDREAARELLREAIASLQQILERLAYHTSAGDAATTLSLLHELKGVSANIGAAELSSLSESFLKSRRRDSRNSIDLDELRSAYRRCEEHARAAMG